MATTTKETTDLYGFPIKVTPLQEAERENCDRYMDVQQQVWAEYVEKDRMPQSEVKVKEMIRKGVAPTCRPWVWMNTSTAAKRKAAMASNYYNIMVSAGANSPFLAEIDQDLPATYPNHQWVQSPDGQAAVRRVLSAYSVHNDKLGYCRAMANIVALLMLAVNRNEETTFWLLASVVEDILYPGTFSRHLEGCQVEMRALDELISHKLPRLHAHLQVTECDISLIATDWYLCLYSTSVPAETACRVWDGLFNEGPKILFRVALALLKMREEELLACDNAGDIVMKMRQAAASTHNHDHLMNVAYDGIGSLPMATIDRFRDAKAREVEAVMRSREGGAAAAAPAASTESGSGSGSTLGGLRLNPSMTRSTEAAADKVKAGFGKFMKWADKAANKTADQMAKAAERMGIKDDEPGQKPAAPK